MQLAAAMKRQKSLGEFCLAKRKNLETEEERHEQHEQDEAGFTVRWRADA